MGPLSGIRVVEIGHALAGPFAGALLADFGAEVIKIEQPKVGDSLRQMGPQLETSSVWWAVTGRNKRSIAIDYKKPEGLELVHSILATTDVVIENLRPGVLDRAGLGWENLHSKYPQLIMLNISGFGQGGPLSHKPGFGKIAEAFSGATHLTGKPDEPPVHPGYSLGDATTGLMGAFGIMVALKERDRSGRGQQIDLALYESLLRMIEWQIPLHAIKGWTAERAGAQFPFGGAFLTDICTTADGGEIVLSAATSKAIESIRKMMRDLGMPDAAEQPVEDMALCLREWIGGQTRENALAVLQSYDVVVGPVYTPEDIITDEQVKARESIVTVRDGSGEDVPMPNVVPKLSSTPGCVRWTGPELGEHSDEILAEIGISSDQILELREVGVVG